MHLAVNPDIYIHIDLILNERPGGIGKQNLRLISYFLNGLCMTGRGMRSIRAARHPEPTKPVEMSGFQNAPVQIVLPVIEWSFPQHSFPAPSRAGTYRSILNISGYASIIINDT